MGLSPIPEEFDFQAKQPLEVMGLGKLTASGCMSRARGGWLLISERGTS